MATVLCIALELVSALVALVVLLQMELAPGALTLIMEALERVSLAAEEQLAGQRALRLASLDGKKGTTTALVISIRRLD
jgi:hypothetical protein